MSKTIEQAKADLHAWCARHDSQRLTIGDIRFGSRYLFAGSVVVAVSAVHTNKEPHIIYVHFVCDTRKTTFPVTIDQLVPVSAAAGDSDTIH